MNTSTTKRGKARQRASVGASIEERLQLHTDRSGKAGCWSWTGSKRAGYGQLNIEGKVRDAHRISYELYVGPIPAGLQIDHLCRNRACCNPEHLEAVTPRLNTLRGESPGAMAVRSQACKRGHDRALWGSPHNVRVYCRLCRIAYLRAHKRFSDESVDLDRIFKSPRRLRLLGLEGVTPDDIPLVRRPGKKAAA